MIKNKITVNANFTMIANQEGWWLKAGFKKKDEYCSDDASNDAKSDRKFRHRYLDSQVIALFEEVHIKNHPEHNPCKRNYCKNS